MLPNRLLQIHAIVRGRVQGVSFRYYTQQKANLLGLRGWVRNNPDGTVETVATGHEDALQEFVEWLHHGPAAAQVRNVDSQFITNSPVGESFASFEIR